jgi:hypothetical protein
VENTYHMVKVHFFSAKVLSWGDLKNARVILPKIYVLSIVLYFKTKHLTFYFRHFPWGHFVAT